MKKYEAPEIDIEKFDIEDVITSSGGTDLGENELPPQS